MTFRRTPYERLADQYDVDRAHWEINPDVVVAELLGNSPPALRVLDVGCGTGLYLTAQREHYPSAPVTWFGMDPSRQMLASAVAKGSEARLFEGLAEHIPVGDSSIDYVYSSFVFHHVTDKDAALDEVARVLRPGGRLRIKNMDPWGQPDWWLYTYFRGAWETDMQRFLPAEKLRAAVEARGFDAETALDREARTRSVSHILEEAERRVISQLAILDDDAFEEGLARLRALPPDEPVPYVHAGVTLTARKR